MSDQQLLTVPMLVSGFSNQPPIFIRSQIIHAGELVDEIAGMTDQDFAFFKYFEMLKMAFVKLVDSFKGFCSPILANSSYFLKCINRYIESSKVVF